MLKSTQKVQSLTEDCFCIRCLFCNARKSKYCCDKFLDAGSDRRHHPESRR